MDTETEANIDTLDNLIQHHYTFIGAKIDTSNTISSLISPIAVKTNVFFIISDENE